jgi:hypothetical protein
MSVTPHISNQTRFSQTQISFVIQNNAQESQERKELLCESICPVESHSTDLQKQTKWKRS